ncbi:MAG: hypothetical protein AAF204_05145, partial [Pseudomonadota bacterium]
MLIKSYAVLSKIRTIAQNLKDNLFTIGNNGLRVLRRKNGRLANAYSVTLSMEGVIEADPDHVIGTGANWAEAKPEVTSTLLGYEGDPAINAERIKALSTRPGFSD